MTAVPLSDEQADRIEAGERPGAIGVTEDVAAALRKASGPVAGLARPVPFSPVTVEFDQECQRCGGSGNELLLRYRCCSDCGGSGRVPVTMPCPECHGRGLADVRGAPPCRRCGNGRARGSGRIPAEASMVHIIPADDVQWCEEPSADRDADVVWVGGPPPTPMASVRHQLRGWVADLPWVLLLGWEGDGR